MKTIWIVNHYAIPPAYGGLNRHYYFAKYLKRMGYQVRIFSSSAVHNAGINMIEPGCRDLTREVESDGVAYTFVKTCSYGGNGLSRVQNMLQFPMRLHKAYRQFERPDVIFTSSPTPFGALEAVRLAKKLRVPVVVEVRDLWPESLVAYKGLSRRNPVMWCLYRLEKYLYKKADRLVFTMPGGADYIKERRWSKAVPQEKLRHINNGVDLEEFDANRVQCTLNDPDLEATDTFKVVYTGSIREVNHVGSLVEAARLMQTMPGCEQVRFLVYGDGTERDPLQQRCEREHITNIVFKGHVERRYIPYILSKADVNVIAVRQSAIMRFGCSLNKLFDYMASGRPVVSNLHVAHDLIAQYGCGVTTQNQEPEELARAIDGIRRLPREEYDKMCANARRGAQDFDYANLTRRYAALLEEVCRQKDALAVVPDSQAGKDENHAV